MTLDRVVVFYTIFSVSWLQSSLPRLLLGPALILTRRALGMLSSPPFRTIGTRTPSYTRVSPPLHQILLNCERSTKPHVRPLFDPPPPPRSSCLNNVILTKGPLLRSGWKTVLTVLRSAAADTQEEVSHRPR